MANISVKDVPDQWAEALRQRAARNHRSLQGELMFLIEQAVQSGDAGVAAQAGASSRRGAVVGLDRFGHPIVRQGWKTMEQVVDEDLFGERAHAFGRIAFGTCAFFFIFRRIA